MQTQRRREQNSKAEGWQRAGRGLFDCFCYTLIKDLYVFVCVEHWKQEIEMSRSERRRKKKIRAERCQISISSEQYCVLTTTAIAASCCGCKFKYA